MKSPLHRLTALGLSVWIDCLSRDLSESGALVRAKCVVGVAARAPSRVNEILDGIAPKRRSLSEAA